MKKKTEAKLQNENIVHKNVFFGLRVSNEDYPELTTDLPKEIAKKKRQGKFIKTNTNRQVKQERKAKRNMHTQRERLEVEELNTTAQCNTTPYTRTSTDSLGKTCLDLPMQTRLISATGTQHLSIRPPLTL